MTLTVTANEDKPGVFRVSPVGSIDSSTYAILEKELESILKASPRVVVFDMDGVTYMSSMGIRVIIKARKALQQNNARLILVNLQPKIKKVFDIISVLPPREIFASIEEMDAYLHMMQQRDGEEKDSP